MGQKMVCFEALRATRSRQDESIEVGEVGSKRPSLGCNGVHVVRWIGLIFGASKSQKVTKEIRRCAASLFVCPTAQRPAEAPTNAS